MYLVDTSYWIELLRKGSLKSLASSFDLNQVLTCPPIIQEVLQGLNFSSQAEEFKSNFLAIPRIGDPVTTDFFLAAAELYKEGRRRGITIRSSVDCLIAAIAIQHSVVILHRDRDYKALAKFSPLKQRETI